MKPKLRALYLMGKKTEKRSRVVGKISQGIILVMVVVVLTGKNLHIEGKLLVPSNWHIHFSLYLFTSTVEIYIY